MIADCIRLRVPLLIFVGCRLQMDKCQCLVASASCIVYISSLLLSTNNMMSLHA
jgi:hypothetical protein